MWIRNYKGKIVFIDISKYKNEKVFYNTLWKIKYNIDVSKKKDTNFEIINLINS
jgi:hypothetical protein